MRKKKENEEKGIDKTLIVSQLNYTTEVFQFGTLIPFNPNFVPRTDETSKLINQSTNVPRTDETSKLINQSTNVPRTDETTKLKNDMETHFTLIRNTIKNLSEFEYLKEEIRNFQQERDDLLMENNQNIKKN